LALPGEGRTSGLLQQTFINDSATKQMVPRDSLFLQFGAIEKTEIEILYWLVK